MNSSALSARLTDPTHSQEVTVTQLPIRVRRTEYGEGEGTEASSVYCPQRHASVSLELCLGCPFYVARVTSAAGSSTLVCDAPISLKPAEGAESLGTRLGRTPVREAMTTAITCVDSELGLKEVAELLERAGLKAAPVVEDGGMLLGMVELGDLIREPAEVSRGTLVEDVMTAWVLELPESASLAEAAQFFANSGGTLAPVIASNGVVVGTLSTLDLVRWIARASSGRAT